MKRVMFGRTSFLFAAMIAGCSTRATEGPSSSPDAGTADASVGCPAGSHAEGATCASTLNVARAGTSVRPVRDHHTTSVIETGGAAFLYVIGGTDAWKTLHHDVLRARIQEDGSLGDFEAIGKLPESRAGHTTVVVGHRIVVAGGHTMDDTGTMSTLDSTISAIVNGDGTLGPWTPGPKLPAPVMHHTCDAVGRFVYCVGGRIDHNFTGTLAVRMAVGEDGTLGAYEPIAPFGQSIGFHMAFVHDHALYVAGGLHRDAPMPEFERLRGIWRLPIAEDGSAGAWASAGELPSARYAGAAHTLRDHVYLAGGQDETDAPTSTIIRATLTPDGRATDAQALPTKLSVARMHVHQTPLFGRWLYSVGGRDAQDRSLGVVDIGTFD